MALCLQCRQFIRTIETVCPHCGVERAVAEKTHAAALVEALAAATDLAERLGLAGWDLGSHDGR